MAEIKRVGAASRYSDVVIHAGRASFSGYVPENTPDRDITVQTGDVLDQIAESLAEIGSAKSRLLHATIWLADIGDFAAMNAVWERWIKGSGPPARATVQARLADARYRLEVQVVAGV